MTYLIGQGLDVPCPVCDLSPIALRSIETLEDLAECARCGLTYHVLDEAGGRLERPVCALSPAFVDVCRTYYRETANLLGPPPTVLTDGADVGPQRLQRMRNLDEWLAAHPQLVATAAAPSSWAYVSLTAYVSEENGERGWAVLAPPSTVGQVPLMPLSCNGLPLGTIVTVSIPVTGEVTPAEPDA